MKLFRYQHALSAVAMSMTLFAAAGCKHPGSSDPADDPPSAEPSQPGAQGPGAAPGDDPSGRQARRHRRHHRGPRDGRRGNWPHNPGGGEPDPQANP